MCLFWYTSFTGVFFPSSPSHLHSAAPQACCAAGRSTHTLVWGTSSSSMKVRCFPVALGPCFRLLQHFPPSHQIYFSICLRFATQFCFVPFSAVPPNFSFQSPSIAHFLALYTNCLRCMWLHLSFLYSTFLHFLPSSDIFNGSNLGSGNILR